MKHTSNFHWIGNTLMAEDFGETVEVLSADWSELDEFQVEHKNLLAAAHDLQRELEALVEACEYMNVSGGSLPDAKLALAKARGEN